MEEEGVDMVLVVTDLRLRPDLPAAEGVVTSDSEIETTVEEGVAEEGE